MCATITVGQFRRSSLTKSKSIAFIILIDNCLNAFQKVIPIYILINNTINLFLKSKSSNISATSSKHGHGAGVRGQGRSSRLVLGTVIDDLI